MEIRFLNSLIRCDGTHSCRPNQTDTNRATCPWISILPRAQDAQFCFPIGSLGWRIITSWPSNSYWGSVPAENGAVAMRGKLGEVKQGLRPH